MAIHELTTNAAKYGAFSTPHGWLEVEWDVRGIDGASELQLCWTERDGPPVEKPSRKGFGSRLIQQLLTKQCRAEIDLDFDRLGLHFQMSVPLVGPGHNEMSPLRAGELSSPGRCPPDGGMTQVWRGGTSSGLSHPILESASHTVSE